MKISELKLNKANPRFIKDDKFKKLLASIKDFPKMMELRPIVYDTDGTILGGNMRYRALTELGYKDIPDTWAKRADELTDDEKRRFIIEDNVGFGNWDMEALASDWDLEELEAWGVDLDWPAESNPFDDEGITAQNKYGVIVECESDADQERIFNELTEQGYKCKVIVV